MIIIQTIITSIFESAPLILATFGIVLIFKTSNTTNFAQGMVGTLGAYVTSYMILATPTADGVIPTVSAGFYLLAIVVGIIVGFLAALFIDAVIIRNSRFANPATKQIITMGIVLVLSGVIPLIFSGANRSLPRLGTNINSGFINGMITVFISFMKSIGISILKHQVIQMFLMIVIIGIIFALLKFTKWGLGVRATSSNEKVAAMMGVNTRFISAMSWSIAGGIGALATIMVTSTTGAAGTLVYYVMAGTQVQAFFSAILGGFGTFFGPIVGALIFTVIKNFAVYYVNIAASNWGMTVTYLSVLLIILVKPNGLFGKRIAKKV